MAYRYKKYGIEVSLSPQDGISCYQGNCQGNYLIDAHLNLVRNGTVTEGCFPYSSTDGKTIPKCINECKDGSELKKYHSQNAYMIHNNNQEYFNELIILLMDQLVTQGPFSAGFDVYEDFYDFAEDDYDCKYDVYSYNGVARYRGGHAVTIVGYGFHYKKIYWLIQNSWGPTWCDSGFMKMEIGQFDELAFSEPLIKHEEIKPVEIQVDYDHQNSDCYLFVNSPDLNKWNNTLNINFKHENTSKDFNFQIGRNKIIGEDEINCFYEQKKVYFNTQKGLYIYKGFESLGEDNIFKLNYFEEKKFEFSGFDDLLPFFDNQNYYISQVGSRILFDHRYEANDDTMPFIYMNKETKTPLVKCDNLKTSTKLKYDYNFAYCEISKDNLDYIDKNGGQTRLYFDILCGYPYKSNIFLNILNTTIYPVFKIIQFIKPNDTLITKKTNLILVSNVTGGTDFYQNANDIFYVIMEVENNEQNTTYLSYCYSKINYENITNLTCYLNVKDDVLEYKNIYLLPYSLIEKTESLYEVYIKQTIKAGDEPINPDPDPEPDPEPTPETDPEPDPEPDPQPSPQPDPKTTFSTYLKYSLSKLFYLILLLL